MNALHNCEPLKRSCRPLESEGLQPDKSAPIRTLPSNAGSQHLRERGRIVDRQYPLKHRVRDDPRGEARDGRFVSTMRARDLFQTKALHANYVDCRPVDPPGQIVGVHQFAVRVGRGREEGVLLASMGDVDCWTEPNRKSNLLPGANDYGRRGNVQDSIL
jgi:hypothetical protein